MEIGLDNCACPFFIYLGPGALVFCQNFSDLLWEKKWFSDWEKLLKFEAEGQEFAKFLRSLEQFIQTVKGQNNFGIKIPLVQA